MKILILGCDGYLGWPTTLRMLSKGHDVYCVDDFTKRKQLKKNGLISAFPLATMQTRIKRCKKIWKKSPKFFQLSVTNTSKLQSLFKKIKPDVIFDFAQIPSAPYSYASIEKCIETWRNNTEGTLNILWAMKKYAPKSHLIKLGTMGEYGTPNVPITEGNFLYKSEDGKYQDLLPFPRQAGSFYHQSKVADTHLISMACKQWKLKCTDIMQGIIYGTRTSETQKIFNTAFYFDETFGTVINRMISAVVCNQPLPVYGTGNMVRGILSLVDAIDCYELIVKNPPKSGEHRVINQFDESKSINEMASIITQIAKDFGFKTKIKHYKAPRIEKQNHLYKPTKTWLALHGYKRNSLFEDISTEILNDLLTVKDRIIKYKNVIPPKTNWK